MSLSLVDLAIPSVPEQTCRDCKHDKFYHTGNIFECGYVAMFLTETNSKEFCPCFKFVPSDNLQYLEAKVKEKEDIKLHL